MSEFNVWSFVRWLIIVVVIVAVLAAIFVDWSEPLPNFLLGSLLTFLAVVLIGALFMGVQYVSAHTQWKRDQSTLAQDAMNDTKLIREMSRAQLEQARVDKVHTDQQLSVLRAQMQAVRLPSLEEPGEIIEGALLELPYDVLAGLEEEEDDDL